MTRIAVLTFNGGAFFELGCALELFALPRPDLSDWYHCEVVSFEDSAATMLGGVSLQAKQVHSLDRYDMLIVPSWPSRQTAIEPALASALRRFYRQGKRLVSFCSGAFLLAELGLLDGRQATTHWKYAAVFQERFPQIDFVNDALYVYDGVIGCSAGSAAALDLGIEIIRRDYGHRIANQVARQLVMASHRQGGQSQFVETPVLQAPGRFSGTIDWALGNLDQPITVDSLAEKASMSRRSFDRKFRASFNQSPNAWLIQQRLQRAQQLLEEKNDNMELVAQQSGFTDSATMRHHFRKQLGISPAHFRRQFAAGK